MTVETAAAEMRSFLFDYIVSRDDAYLTEGLSPKVADYLLRMAERDPSIRPALATATRLRRQSRPRSARPTQLVYFIQRGAFGPIKIGTAADPAARLRALQTGSDEPLRLLGSMDGGRPMEASLHRRFGRARLSGEWFSPSTDLLGFIAEVSR